MVNHHGHTTIEYIKKFSDTRKLFDETKRKSEKDIVLKEPNQILSYIDEKIDGILKQLSVHFNAIRVNLKR